MVAGVGYGVSMTADSLANLGKKTGVEILLWIHTAVREDAIELYGFSEKNELEFFELLLRVSGIGPKSALAVMSTAPVATLRQAIAQNNLGYLTKISGIGKKTAEKIVFELKDRVELRDIGEASGSLREDTDTLEALKSLGYSQEEAREAVKELGLADGKSVSARVTEALKILGAQK